MDNVKNREAGSHEARCSSSLIGGVIMQVQKESGNNVGILKESADDAAGTCGFLDGVRDPPPRGTPADVLSRPTLLGRIPYAGRDESPVAGSANYVTCLAATLEGSFHHPFWSQQEEKRLMVGKLLLNFTF